MRISDWSSDVCSSDLAGRRAAVAVATDIDGVRLPRHCLRGVGLALQPIAGEHALRHEHHRIVGRCLAKCRPLPLVPRDRKSTRLKLQPLMRVSYAVFCLKKKTHTAPPNKLSTRALQGTDNYTLQLQPKK